jgi:hypothetical protein
MPPGLILEIGRVWHPQLRRHHFSPSTSFLGIENYPDFRLHHAPVEAPNRLRIAEPTFAGSIYVLVVKPSDINRNSPGFGVRSGEADVYDSILRIRRKTDRPLEPIKMEIATAHRLETRLISKNDPSEGTGDLLAEVVTPFRKHIEAP